MRDPEASRSCRAWAARALCLWAVCLSSGCDEAPPPAPTTTGDPLEALTRFDEWSRRFQVAPRSERDAITREGIALAEARHDALLELAEKDPRAAADQRLPFHLYRDLPPAIAARIERPIDTVASYEVTIHEPDDGTPWIERQLIVEGDRYEVVTWGRRLRTRSRDRLRVHGYLLGDLAVLTDSPVRTLLRGEAPPPGRTITGEGCEDESEERRVDLGDEVRRVCSRTEVLALEEEALETEWATGPRGDGSKAWTHGFKRVLYLRVDFSDAPGAPVDEQVAHDTLEEANAYYQAVSYGKLSLGGDVSPVLRLPRSRADYQATASLWELVDDARSVAVAAGYDPADYDLDVVALAHTFGATGGSARLGARGLALQASFSAGLLIHELGHNLGAAHASALRTHDGSVVGPGDVVVYGNPFSVMGSAGGRGGMSAFTRHLLGWLPPEAIGDASAGGTFTLADLDQDPSSAGAFQALRIERNPVEHFWLEYRPDPNQASTRRGTLVYLVHEGTGADMTFQTDLLLDMRPTPRGHLLQSFYDAPLLIGRTFTDPVTGLRITPTGLGGSPTEPTIELDLGEAGSNVPPTVRLQASATEVAIGDTVTMTAEALDPDGDPLHFIWEFQGRVREETGPTLQLQFSFDDVEVVRCTVTDGRGGEASDTVAITVGEGTPVFNGILSGVVRRDGAPIAGVLVSNSSNTDRSDSNGRYFLRGSRSSVHELAASLPGHQVIPATFQNPVGPTDDRYDLDFEVLPNAYRLSGRVMRSDGPAVGALVRSREVTAFTDRKGEFALVHVPACSQTLEARSLRGRVFEPATFSNPLAVGQDRVGLDFEERSFVLSGEIVGGAGSVVITNGRTSTTSYEGDDGRWYYEVQVPGGLTHLWVEGGGSSFEPTFEVPILVGEDEPGLDFVAATEEHITLLGRVMDRGLPAVGVRLSIDDREATVDAGGWWVITGLPAGRWKVVPDWNGLRFAPAFRVVDVTDGVVGGLDFETVPALQGPWFVLPPTPAADPVLSASVQLETRADDDGGERALRYRWEATGPGEVSFAPDGENAARQTEATFHLAGTYRIAVVAEDEDGLVARQVIRLEVQAHPSALEIAPEAAVLSPGERVLFRSLVLDPFGNALDPQPQAQWSASPDDPIDAGGWFEATLPGVYDVHATVGDLSATVPVQVIGPPAILSVEAEEAAVVGEPWQAEVIVAGDGADLTFHWSVGGDAPVYFLRNGTAASRETEAIFLAPGLHEVQVLVRDERGGVDMRTLSVDVRPAPDEGSGGTGADSGGDAAAPDTGCGCTTGSGTAALPILLVLGWMALPLRRRG